jgi:hypothetical protein
MRFRNRNRAVRGCPKHRGDGRQRSKAALSEVRELMNEPLIGSRRERLLEVLG